MSLSRRRQWLKRGWSTSLFPLFKSRRLNTAGEKWKGFHLRLPVPAKPICIHYNKKCSLEWKVFGAPWLINFYPPLPPCATSLPSFLLFNSTLKIILFLFAYSLRIALVSVARVYSNGLFFLYCTSKRLSSLQFSWRQFYHGGKKLTKLLFCSA